MKILSIFPETEYLQSPHTACTGCGLSVAIRYFLKAIGEKIVFVMPPGCASVIVNIPKRAISYKGQPIGLLACPFGAAATFAAGFKTGLTMVGDLETVVVPWAGDGATFDIGFGAVSAAAERNEDFIYVCYDNEAYMNTGNQRSSATPKGATTYTNPFPVPKNEHKKDIMLILADHNIPYAATMTIAYPRDFMRKVQKAKGMKGFRFLHMFTPCPTGWRFPTEWTMKLSRLAVQTKVFPLFEVENGNRFILNKEPARIPLEEYLKVQGRFSHLNNQEIEEFKEKVEQRWEWLKWLGNYKNNRPEEHRGKYDGE
ncbi:MAG: thiamine pyrophosphate-dependent enzyme [Proteobacteria bacterium]|nr:thiamine pyrophosphate-dependent enzyme [Pseudomonadota bacterium]